MPIVKRGRKKEYKFKFVDLFCGVGGFHQAMEALGGKCVFACDINDLCRSVYEMNYKIPGDELIIAKDIKTAAKENNVPAFDVLCGGFPCQTFSKAGKRNGFQIVENENGEKDDRGQLFFRIVDILKDHPECNYVILENVRNLADNEENWQVVCKELKELGFVITEEPIIESPHHFGRYFVSAQRIDGRFASGYEDFCGIGLASCHVQRLLQFQTCNHSRLRFWFCQSDQAV